MEVEIHRPRENKRSSPDYTSSTGQTNYWLGEDGDLHREDGKSGVVRRYNKDFYWDLHGINLSGRLLLWN